MVGSDLKIRDKEEDMLLKLYSGLDLWSQLQPVDPTALKLELLAD